MIKFKKPFKEKRNNEASLTQEVERQSHKGKRMEMGLLAGSDCNTTNRRQPKI
jgi:hypothetical protein